MAKDTGRLGLVIPYYNFFNDKTRLENLRRTLDSLSPSLRKRTIVAEALSCRSDSEAATMHEIVDRVEVPRKYGSVCQRFSLIKKGFSLLQSDPHYSHYAWMEPGAIISDCSWDKECQELMIEKDLLAVQPFTAVSQHSGDTVTEVQSHGVSWVYDAEAYRQSGGTFCLTPLGGGDDLHYYAMHGEAGRVLDHLAYAADSYMEAVKLWQTGWSLAFDRRIGKLDTTLASTCAHPELPPAHDVMGGSDIVGCMQELPCGAIRWSDDTPPKVRDAVKDFLRAQ